jgi:quinol monooxygenase YgiN
MEFLIAKLQNSKDCMGSEVYRRINRRNPPSYSLVSEWRSTEAVEKHFKSKNFNILSGAIRNLCDPPMGTINIKSTEVLETKYISYSQ